MGQKKAATPRQSEEEKAAAKMLKACESMLKAAKDDELKKVEDAVSKGANINFQNDMGHTAAHVAAAFGALSVLRYLHKQGADLEMINEKKMTPLMAARHIGEENAAKLIEALLAGLSGDDIGKEEDENDDGEMEKAMAAASVAAPAAAAPELEVVEASK